MRLMITATKIVVFILFVKFFHVEQPEEFAFPGEPDITASMLEFLCSVVNQMRRGRIGHAQSVHVSSG